MGVKVKEKVKGSNEWWIFINYQGKRKAKKIGHDKRIAQEVAKKIEAKLTLGEMSLDQKVPTLKEYVDGWHDVKGEYQQGWYEKTALLSLKHSTYRSYRLMIDHDLYPAFGSKPINTITSRMISDLISKKIRSGAKSNTARNIKNCLSAIMRHAVNPDGYLSTNTARGVPIPKPEDEKQRDDVHDPFTWDEREVIEQRFLSDFPDFYPLVLCGFRTGLRIGELIALQWQDIDFHQKLILVQRNVTRGKTTTPKSRSSRRHVRMTSQLAEVLRQHKVRMKQKTLKSGWESMPEWVFVNGDGEHLNYVTFIRYVWNRAMERSGLRRRTPHQMRHTYATLRLSKGDSLAEVSKEMGHASTEITYRTYYKWLPKESRSDIDELDARPNATYAQPEIKKGLVKVP